MQGLAIFHSFTGTLEEAQGIIEKGYVIGVGGQITYTNNEEARSILSQLPVDSIILETDAPYLSPHPLRGKRNEPANVLLTANVIKDVLGIKMQELAKITTQTAERLFHWSTISE